jgi:hypothetical protein
VGSCEHGNEPSGSIKCGQFLDYLSVLLASQGELCSMELAVHSLSKCVLRESAYLSGLRGNFSQIQIYCTVAYYTIHSLHTVTNYIFLHFVMYTSHQKLFHTNS